MKKRTKIISSLAAATLLVFGGLSFHYKDAILFEKATKEIFQSELKGDTLSLHYTLAYPEKWNLADYEVLLQPYSSVSKQETAEELQNHLTALDKLDHTNLNETSSLDYNLIYDYMKTEQTAQNYFYYNEPLSPNSGMATQLPILLAEYTFRSKQDVTDYLEILNQSGDYFAGLFQFEKEKADQGLFMTDSSIQKVIEQCDLIMNAADLESGTHFLHTTFEERISPLVENGILTSEEKEFYISENNRMITTVMKPAYDQLSDSLYLLLGSGVNEEGLTYFPQGKEYYLHLLEKNTCSSKDIVAVKNTLKNNFNDLYKQLSTLIQENSAYLSTISEINADTLPLSTPEEMLAQLQQAVKVDFPSFPSTSDTVPSHEVKNISQSLQKYSSPAFYLTPPMDDLNKNTIYINPKNNASGLSLYTTLAHEGYPGHLYQTVYSSLNQQNTGNSPLRHLLYYGGYVEGWALYTEILSYDYAKSLVDPADKSTLFLYELERLEEQLQLCLYSILDVSIHYDGISLETASGLLQKFGITDEASCRNIYEYIRDEPTNYLKYYLGYLEILELKELAKSTWQEEYSELKFHTFVLNMGPCDFDTLREYLVK